MAIPKRSTLPPTGSRYFVLKLIVDPYQGYGCGDTLTATLQDTSQSNPRRAPPTSCNNAPVRLGVIPKPGYVYSWSPPTGLSDPNAIEPGCHTVGYHRNTYLRYHEGGAAFKDTVMVYAAVLDNTIRVIQTQYLLPGRSAGGNTVWYNLPTAFNGTMA